MSILKRSVTKKLSLLLSAASAALFAVSCADYDDNASRINPAANAEKPDSFFRTIGLTPGADETELNIAWYGRARLTEAYVRVYDDSDTEIPESPFTGMSGKVPAKTAAPSPNPEYSYHKVTVTGLTPGETYQYQISNDGASWSPKYNYAAPPAGNFFKFGVTGDPQLTQRNTVDKGEQDPTNTPGAGTTRQGWAGTVQKLKAKGVNFIAGVGDQVDRTGTPADACEVEYEYFFEPADLRTIPFAPAMGNHDRHNQFTYHYNLPNANATVNTYSTAAGAHSYYYTYLNALFVVVNTSYYPASVAEATTHVNAMESLINAAKSAHPGTEWLIVQHHKSTHSAADHMNDPDIGYWVQAGFNKIMIDNGVDLVLSGHDHVYSRTGLVMADNLTSKGEVEQKVPINGTIEKTGFHGTVFMGVNTSSGLKYYDLFVPSPNYSPKSGARWEPINNNYPYLANGTSGWNSIVQGWPDGKIPSGDAAKDYSAYNSEYWPWATHIMEQNYEPEYTVITVNGNSLTAETRTQRGDKLVDAYTYTKAGPAL
jgi:hypothetical protein